MGTYLSAQLSQGSQPLFSALTSLGEKLIWGHVELSPITAPEK